MNRLLFILLLCLHYTPALLAQASLASEDIIDDVSVKSSSGEQLTYTLVRDAIQKDQWYYFPTQARLYEIKSAGGATEPEFTLLKYQYNNPQKPGELLEGGIIQFAIVLSPDNTSLSQLKSTLLVKTGNPRVRLGALPMKEASVKLVTPKGEFLAEGSETAGIAPLLATQKMVFSLTLSKIGTDIYDALVNSNTGMGVVVNFTYTGLTPPAGFKITVDWDESYKFFSKNEVTRAKVGGMYSWFCGSAEYKKEKQQIVKELKESKCIKVEAITGENFNDSMLYKYIDPILQKITAELFNTSDFNNRLDSMLVAASLSPDTAGPRRKQDGSLLNFLNVSVGKSVAIKDIRMVKKGRQEFNFNIKQLVERKSLAGGFVGLGRYPKAVKDKLAILIAGGKWESAYFILPPITDDDDIGIKKIGLEIKLTNKGRYYSGQVFNWTKTEGWTDRNGTKRTVAAFPLIELAKEDPEMKGKAFELKMSINSGNDEFTVIQEIPAGNTENNVALPMSIVDMVKVDPDLLTFRKLNPESQLDYVSVTLSDGTRTKRATILPRSLNGTAVVPRPVYWMLGKAGGGHPVTAHIQFVLKNGKKINWKGNGNNLSDPGMSYEIILQDADYLESN